jgi:hypothetical protein
MSTRSGYDVPPHDCRMAGRLAPVDDVAQLVVEGITDNQLYLFPHPEARRFIARRFERMDRAFD